MNIENNLDNILRKYSSSFESKIYSNENNDSDILMEIFGITPELKRENRQYWGRELGKCWESLVVEICKNSPGFKPALKIEKDEPCDLRMNNYAIDAKYRIGSGDSGTLKKFKQYSQKLISLNYEPVLLFLREDNLAAAITACRQGGWTIKTGKYSFDFIKEISGFDLRKYLVERHRFFNVVR